MSGWGFGSQIIGLAGDIAINQMNNYNQQKLLAADRQANYQYNEMSANNADQRTRALYNDIYAPSALLERYQQAGLSPSLMFGGTPGQGGSTGAQANGAAGPTTPFMPMSLVEAAQVATLFAQADNIKADTDKKEAETRNIREDTILKQTQEIWQTFLNDQKREEVNVATAVYMNPETNEIVSLYDIANKARTFEEFQQTAYKYADKDIQSSFKTHYGTKILQDVYYNANKLERDINVLTTEEVDATFSRNLMQALQKEGFAEQNAKTAIAQMEAAAESANLTKEQKQAWNNIIQSLRDKDSKMADIMIVASMILNQAASHWHVSTGK